MSRLKSILLIEDDKVDAITVKKAFQGIGASDRIVHLAHGEAALAYLKSELNELPDLILLDLNMPRMNGIDFLQEIKQDSRLNTIPVIVLTTSDDRQDVTDSFTCSAAGYMTKPVDFEQFKLKMKTIEDYWAINRLPGHATEVC